MEKHHFRFDRITIDPEKCFGKPCIRGLRMPVEEILPEWPELEPEDIQQALSYVA